MNEHSEEQWERQHKEWLKSILIQPPLTNSLGIPPEDTKMVGSFYSEPAQELAAASPLPLASAPRFQCTQCGMTLASKSALTAHLRSHRPASSPPEPHRCDVCNKTFAVPARLVRHYRTHTGERPFKCDFCPKMFSVKENLQVHRRIHTKERPYRCSVCGSAFEHSGKLHRHMRIHTGERPHACRVCGKTFIQSGQLVIHQRTHTGEKPYRCTVPGCGKGFTCSKQLKVHSRTHTGEKPYHCDICFRDFGYNHVLKLHRFQHYGAKCYKCTICDDTFKSKKEMEAHIRQHAEGGQSNNAAKETSADSCYLTSLPEQPLPLVLERLPLESQLETSEVSYKFTLMQHCEDSFQTDQSDSRDSEVNFKPSCVSPPYSPVPRYLATYGGTQGDIVRCVEAALAVAAPPTPPPSTPERSSSPEDSFSSKDASTLPLRKRKLYMTGAAAVATVPVRTNSVIQFAPAS